MMCRFAGMMKHDRNLIRVMAHKAWLKTTGWRVGLLLVLGVLAGAPLRADTWHDAGASWRVRVHPVKNSPGGAPVSVVSVAPCGIDAARCKVSVYTADGTRVNAGLLWATNGDMFKIAFDTGTAFSGSSFLVYLQESAKPEINTWRPTAGLFLETRRAQPGRFDEWDRALRQFNSSGPILGRSPVSLIFQGIHPHGAATNFMGYYSGYIKIPKADEYEFCIVSSSPSYLRIDNKLVVNRGPQERGRGTHGQFSGKARLAAGRHQIEYLFMHTGGEWLAEVGWKPPGAKYLDLMPGRVYEPVGQFEVVEFETAPGAPRRAYFEWEMVDHNMVDDMALVNVGFRAFGLADAITYQWELEDGYKGQGKQLLHPLAARDLRRATLEVTDQDGHKITLGQAVNVQPNWLLAPEWSDPLFEKQKKMIVGSNNVPQMQPEDLRTLVKFADRVEDRALLTALGTACVRAQEQFNQVQAEAFYLLGFHYEHPEMRDYKMAELCWRLAMERALPSIREKARLRNAIFQVNIAGKPQEALRLLERIEPTFLETTEVRLKTLTQADALWLQGKVPEAVKIYETVGNLVNELSRTQNMRNRARLESARDFVRRFEYTKAEEVLRQLEWETPLERISMEAGTTRIQLYLGRKEYPRALTRCEQLLHVAVVDIHRSELMYYQAEIYKALGQDEEAGRVLAKLLKDYPYSEATAKAKDKWGISLPADKKRK